MTSYIIAGSSDSEDLTTCENLARKIKSVYSNIEFNFVLKHPSEWDNCIKTLCRHYGFKKQTNPIIFAKTGKLIGSTREFIILAKEKFDIDALALRPEIEHSVNVEVAENDYYERHREKTLLERIEASYTQSLESGRLNKIKGFYETEIDQGIIYYVKNTKQIAPKIEVPKVIKKPVEPEEVFQNVPMDFVTGMTSKRPETSEGTVKNFTAAKTMTEGFNNAKPIETQASEQEAVRDSKPQNPTSTVNVDNITVEQGLEANPEGTFTIEQGIEKVGEGELNLEPKNENPTQELEVDPELVNTEEHHETKSDANRTSEVGIKKKKGPMDFDYEVLADRLVDNLGDGYYLALHSDPLFEGQSILFFDGWNDFKTNYIEDDNEIDPNENPSHIGLYDFSCFGRKRFLPDVRESHEEEKTEKLANSVSAGALTNKEHLSWMNLEHINIFEPYSEKDWDKIAHVLTQMDSYAYFQILPEGQKNYRILSDGIVNVVPRKFLLLENKNHGIKNKSVSEDESLPFENIIYRYAQAQEKKTHVRDLLIESLPFKHSFGVLKNHESLNGAILKQTYLDMMITLNERCDFNLAKAGVNLIATSEWMLLVPIFKPYMQQRETKIYLDPLAYLGYLIKPIVEDIWPQTGKLNLDVYSRKPRQILIECTDPIVL